MAGMDRRTFLKVLGVPALASAVSLDLSKAVAIPANNRTGSIKDVEHVIFLMQENRSFDHFFGTMRGVRGFAEPHPVSLPSGRPVFRQPDGSGELLPFRPKMGDLGKRFLPDPPHGWTDTHAAWNAGWMDQFVPNKGVTTMTYHERRDLPYQFALAEAFTVCDSYFCSLLGPTDPNRYHMWTGWVGNDGKGGGPVIDNSEAGYDWSTYPERLLRAGISWKVYQDAGDGLNQQGSWGWTADPYIGNYGDNSLLYFHQYQNAKKGSPLAEAAKTGTHIVKQHRRPEALLSDFRKDVEFGRLPSVSWIVAPEAYSEHPNWQPDYGAWYMSQVVDILASNPDVWSKMVLFVTYDEEGGHFDHVVPPTPPMDRSQGLSTVETTNEIFPGNHDYPAGPYGLGIRVPMIVVSPWSRGGWVNSQVFDHTSLIRFLEARFAHDDGDLIESNITPWRRAVTGDLTRAFDFTSPNRNRRLHLPDTTDFEPRHLVRHHDDVPEPPQDQKMPVQEKGVRHARAIPYTLHADSHIAEGTLRIRFANTGGATAYFNARSTREGEGPRGYTVEPGKSLVDAWAASSKFDVSVHGPNGFFRRFKGGRTANLDIRASYDERDYEIELTVRNRGTGRASVTLRERYTGRDKTIALKPGGLRIERWPLAKGHGWYDVTVSVAEDEWFAYQYVGHVEDGEDSITDPIMGGLV
jgi:phospholipase C